MICALIIFAVVRAVISEWVVAIASKNGIEGREGREGGGGFTGGPGYKYSRCDILPPL